ncbi:sensor histidine kinase [Rarobacter incanus]
MNTAVAYGIGVTESPSTLTRLVTWPDRHRAQFDAILALVVTAFSLLAVVSNAASLPADAKSTFTDYVIPIAATLVICVPLAFRRSHPTLASALTYSGALAHMLAGVPLVFTADLAVPMALFAVTAYGTKRAYTIAAIGAGAGSVMVAVLFAGTAGYSAALAVFVAIFVGLIFAAVFAFALVRRSRLAEISQLAARAKTLEQERDAQAVQAASNERTRIAREMHDIIAHSLTVLIAQADGGRYAAAADPQAAVRSLETIGEVGRAALADVRRLLGVLRDGTPDESAAPGSFAAPDATMAGGLGVAPTSPQPGVEGLTELIEQMRTARLRVSYAVTGRARRLPPGIGLMAYRICQESLTNVLKHAGPDPAVSVLVAWGASSITIEVSDDGRGASAPSDGVGHGVIGMRERAAMIGANLQAGPKPGGGYRVRCVIPVPTERSQPQSEEIPSL